MNQVFNQRVKRYYRTIPSVQKQYVQNFEKYHKQKSMQVDGVRWDYFDSEADAEVLLLLHGGFVGFDMWIHQIVEFETDYRIIAPTCPVLPDAKMKVYSDGLFALLQAEKINNVIVMGYSEGGLIAQCFLRDHPEIVKKVILAHTFYPSDESVYYQNNFKIFRIMPPSLTEMLFRKMAKPDKEELDHHSVEWLEWFKCWFKEIKAKLTKGTIITHIDLMIDFVRNYEFDSSDLSSWKGRILITVAEDDVVLKYFDGLKRLYLNAEYHMFQKGFGGHSIALITPKVFNQRIREFLESQI